MRVNLTTYKTVMTIQGLLNLQAVAGESPRAVVDSMADIFVALKKHHLELLAQLLNHMVHQENFPSARCTKQEKEQFTSQLLK